MDLPKWTSEQILALRPTIDRPESSTDPIQSWWESEAFGLSGKSREIGSARVLTVLLRGSECQFRCLMCDLWKETHPVRTLAGAIPSQIGRAIARTPDPRSQSREARTEMHQQWIKLYNASNFFAPINVPTEDLQDIADHTRDYQRVIVENHPRVLTRHIVDFRDRLNGTLEIAMGLETVHPKTLASLNKRMTTEDYSHACTWLASRKIDVRSFVLLRPPGMNEQQGVEWCLKSVRFALENGARHVSVIPLRSGNGAIEKLQSLGYFEPPTAQSLERVLDTCNEELSNRFGAIVTADLWDWDRLRGTCAKCRERRRSRIEKQNLTQNVAPRIACSNCDNAHPT